MHTKTLSELSALLQAKQISATELAKLFLKRIGDSQLNAFLHVDESLTLKQAELADERLARNEATPLTGVPIAHKDIFVTKDWRSNGRLENSGELHQSVQTLLSYRNSRMPEWSCSAN